MRTHARCAALAAIAWLAGALPPAAAPAFGADATVPAVPARESIETLWQRGEAAFEAGDLAAALRLFSEALALDEQRARSWNYLGGAHFALGDVSRALRDFRRAFELDPRDVRIANNLGTALERVGDLPGAEEAYRTAARIDPSYPPTQRNLGILLARLGNRDGARRSWQRYLELAPAGRHAAEVRQALDELDAPVPPADAAPAPEAAPEPSR